MTEAAEPAQPAAGLAPAVLEPLAGRYAQWLGLPAAVLAAPEDDPAQEQGLQVLLRGGRTAAPPRRGAAPGARRPRHHVGGPCRRRGAGPAAAWHGTGGHRLDRRAGTVTGDLCVV